MSFHSISGSTDPQLAWPLACPEIGCSTIRTDFRWYTKNRAAARGVAAVPDPHTITRLLHRWHNGDAHAFEHLAPLVYQELRRIARHYMRHERAQVTLQPTALVHEAFVRLASADISWLDRKHFFAIAARQMRRILVDTERSRLRSKRGGQYPHFPLDEKRITPSQAEPDVLELNDALEALKQIDSRKAEIVELHFFGGLTGKEIASLLEISPATVQRELRFAKAWLYNELVRN